MPIDQLNNGDSGLKARNIINNVVAATNNLPTTGTSSFAYTASSLQPTTKVAAEIFMNPQTITSNITIPESYNAFLLSSVGISGSVNVSLDSNLTILPDKEASDIIEIEWETLRGPDPGPIINPIIDPFSIALQPGKIYAIKGFNKNMPSGSTANPCNRLPQFLYDDGTNSGITIYLEALTINKFATTGYGLFYNPVYVNQDKYLSSNPTERFYGIWDGDNPNPADVPTYQLLDIVFWGGYAWQNISGNNGTAIDAFRLSSADWEKITYAAGSEVGGVYGVYEPVFDEITVDLSVGIITGRYNSEHQVKVQFNSDDYSLFFERYFGNNILFPNPTYCNPIALIPWGLYPIVSKVCGTAPYGISNIEAFNSWPDLISFKGIKATYLKLNDSLIYRNYLGRGAVLSDLTLTSNSRLSLNTLTYNSSIEQTEMRNGFVGFNILTGDCKILKNKLDYSEIFSNQLTGNSLIESNIIINNSELSLNLMTNSHISKNHVENSRIQDNNVDSGLIENNFLINDSTIEQNLILGGQVSSNNLSTISAINNCYIYANNDEIVNNNLSNSAISWLYLQNTSKVYNNELNDSYLQKVRLNGSTINRCTFTATTWYLAGSLSNVPPPGTDIVSKDIKWIDSHGVIISYDLSNAGPLYNSAKKTIYNREDSIAVGPRMMYYVNTDTPTIVLVNAL